MSSGRVRNGRCEYSVQPVCSFWTDDGDESSIGESGCGWSCSHERRDSCRQLGHRNLLGRNLLKMTVRNGGELAIRSSNSTPNVRLFSSFEEKEYPLVLSRVWHQVTGTFPYNVGEL